jgi:hypothetical protein
VSDGATSPLKNRLFVKLGALIGVVALVALGLNLWPRQWRILREDGSLRCTVKQGSSASEVKEACGDPTREGDQPKVAKGWTSFCCAPCELRDASLVFYDCQGKVAQVEALTTEWQGCVLKGVVSVSQSGSPRSVSAPAKSSAPECIPGNKLQTAPRKIRDRKPDLSDLPDVQTHASVLIFDVTVGPSGSVVDARLVKPIDAEQPWPTIAERSRAAIFEWRFEPATVDNKPVKWCMTVTVNVEAR